MPAQAVALARAHF